MEKLISVNEMSLNFNLRQPKGNKSTNVYAVVKCGSTQIKFPTGCKVNTWQWDKRKQTPTINGCMTDGDRGNNQTVMSVLAQIRFGFLNYFSYICQNGGCTTEGEVREIFNGIINDIKENGMNEGNLRKSVVRTPKATTLLKKAFDLYYKLNGVKESSLVMRRSQLGSYIEYCSETGQDKKSMLSKDGICKFQSYLIGKRDREKEEGRKSFDSNANINRKVGLIEMLVNFMAGNSEFGRYGISTVRIAKLKEFKAKGEEKKRRPLTDNELRRLAECECLTEREKEYRDLFLLECYCSYRVSDTHRMFDKSLQEKKTINGQEYIMIDTKKEGVKSVIWVNDKVREILNRYENGFRYVNLSNPSRYESNLINNLKEIARKAGLDSTETFKDANGVERKQPLYEIIGSHFGRYTFIYNGLFKWGMTADELKYFTGHANDKMINEVYAVYSRDDKFNVAHKAVQCKALNRQADTHRETITKDNINERLDLIEEVKQAIYCLGGDLNDYVSINDYHRLNEVLYNKFHYELVKLGIDRDAKEIYRLDKLSLEEKREEIRKLREEIMKRQTGNEQG